MSSTKEAQLLAAVDVSHIDATLPFRAIVVPTGLPSSPNWGLIVAVHGATWNGRFEPTKFYWDADHNEIKMVLSRPEAAMEILDSACEFLTNLFQNGSEIQHLNDEAQALLNDGGDANKRQRQEDDGAANANEDSAQPSRPQNPATVSDNSQSQNNESVSLAASVVAAPVPVAPQEENPFSHLAPQPQQPQNFPQQNSQYQPSLNDSYIPNLPHLNSGPLEQLHDGTFKKQLNVRAERIGLIIGQSGKTIRLLKSITNANITIDHHGQDADNRTITLNGTEAQIHQAELQIAMVLILSQQTVDMTLLPKGSTSERIDIPSDTVGAVIGKSGDNIRLVQILSHAHVAMDKESGENINLRGIVLSGTQTSIDKAKDAIQKLIDSFKDPSPTQRFDPQMILFGIPNQSSRVIIIDNSIVGHVIGVKGANFNNIRNTTNCQISVDKNLKNPKRELTITGPTDSAVNQAVSQITRIVDEAQQTVGQKYGGFDRYGNNNNNGGNGYSQGGGHRHGPSLHQQPQHVGGYGHQRMAPQQQQQQQQPHQYQQQQQQPYSQHHYGQPQGQQQPSQQQAYGQHPARQQPQGQQPYTQPQGQQQYAQPQAQPYHHQGQQQHPGRGPQPAAPQAAPVRPQPLRPVPPEKLATFYGYYDHYITQFPPQEALQYSHHYIDNPPQ